jgi:hypothetical protein
MDSAAAHIVRALIEDGAATANAARMKIAPIDPIILERARVAAHSL